MSVILAMPEASSPVLETLTTNLGAVTPEQLDALPLPEASAGYRRVTLRRDRETEVAAARWVAGGQSMLHGHDDSAALYVVHAGVVEEERYVPDGDSYRCETAVLRAGDQSYLPPGSFHCVRALEDAVTLHTYSPPPQNTTSSVPRETLRMLVKARRQATRQRPRTVKPARPRPDLMLVVRELLEGWAEREARANQLGQLSLPSRTLEEMRSCGILAAPMPESLSGWNASLAQTAAAIRVVAQRAPATALALVMPLGNAATTRIPEMAVPRTLRPALVRGQRWIAGQVRRGQILAVANSEPGAGGDLAQTKTRADQGVDGIHRLTGRKSFATFGRDADYFLCAARRFDLLQGKEVVDGFFVARNAEGLTIDDRWNPVGMRPTASVGLTLQDTPAEAVLGYPGCLEGVNARHWSTVLFAAVFLGVGEGALREGIHQTATDAVWARATLADAALNLEAAAGFIEAVARDDRWPMPDDLNERARRAKTFVARAAVETAVQAAMISGGRSYTPDHPVFRFLCDALAGPLLRPPLPKAMDALIHQLFPAGLASARNSLRSDHFQAPV